MLIKPNTVHNSSPCVCVLAVGCSVAFIVCVCVFVVLSVRRFKKLSKIVIAFRSFDVIFHGVSLMFRATVSDFKWLLMPLPFRSCSVFGSFVSEVAIVQSKAPI